MELNEPQPLLDQLDEFQQLASHYQDIKNLTMREQFQADAGRFNKYTLTAADITLDYSKNRITDETLTHLFALAKKRKLSTSIQAMFRGDLINSSENRPALHTALRNFSDDPVIVDGEDVMPEVRSTLIRMKEFCWKIRNQHWRGFNNKPFTDVVSIGIGGSFLGPKLVS